MAKRRLRGWNPPLENINALVASGGPRLLARARELVVTNGYAANACEAFAANLVGGYLIGVALGVFHHAADLPPELKLFVITGFLGGLTTVSTFSAEVVERLLAGQLGWALAAAGLHVVGSLTMTWLGLVSVGAQRIWS